MSTTDTISAPAADGRSRPPHLALDRRRRARVVQWTHRARLQPGDRRGAGAQVALADQAEIDEAIASAQRGYELWSRYSIAKRQTVLFAFRELLNARKLELAEIITAEHGKVVSDAMGEILRGQEVVELATGFPHLIKGAFSENASTGIDVYSLKQPLGVVGVISPFNFPAMVPMWFFPIAIAAGNAVVLKPSEKDPSAALWLAQLWKEAGLPDGVFTVLQGDKLAVDGLLHQPGRAVDLVRRLDPDRAVHLRDRLAQRQARAGARRCEEPHAGASRRRPRPRRRPGRQRRLRRRRGALHGDLGRARRRAGRRRPDRQDHRAHRLACGSATVRAWTASSPTWVR